MNCNYIGVNVQQSSLARSRAQTENEGRRKKRALAGNRTRVARVASEHSTTEPPVLVVP